MSHDSINNGNPIELPVGGNSNEGIIRIHSDSQQSLDRLFNTSNGEATVPLRNRNLPASFFNPSWQAGKDGGGGELPSNQQQRGNFVSLHSRSTSFEPGRNLHSRPHTSAHFRTRSTLAPSQATVPQEYYSANIQEVHTPIASVPQLHGASTFNATVNPPGVDVEHNLYYDMGAVGTMTDTNYNTPNHQHWGNPTSLHSRSTSFEPGRNLSSRLNNSTHFRTQSNLTPSQATISQDYYSTGNHEAQTSMPPPAPTQLHNAPTFNATINPPDVGDKHNLYYDTDTVGTMTDTNFTPPNQQQRSNPVSLHTRSTNFAPGRNLSSQLLSSADYRAAEPTRAPSQAAAQQDYYSTSNHEVQTSMLPPVPTQLHNAPTFNASINPPDIDVKHNLYYDMETVSTMADTNYTLNSAWLAG